jgi:hypothetical protein
MLMFTVLLATFTYLVTFYACQRVAARNMYITGLYPSKR